jgi:hypothetical protein
MGVFSDILSKSRFEQQPVKGNFIPRPDPKKNTTSDDGDKATVLRHGQLVKESPRPVPGTPDNISRPDPKDKTGGKGKRVGGLFETDASTPDDSTYIIGMEKATSTSGARGWKAMQDGRLSSGQSYKFPYRQGKTGWGGRKPQPDRRKNIDRTTIRKPETINSMVKAVYEYLHKRQEPDPERLKELLDAGKIDQAGYDALVSGKAGSAPAVKKPQDALESARARHFGRKRLGENRRADQSGERSAQRQRDVYRQQMEKAETFEVTKGGRGLEGMPKGGLRPSKDYRNPYWKAQAERRESRFRQVAEHRKSLAEATNYQARKPQNSSEKRAKAKAATEAAGLEYAGMKKAEDNIYAIATAAAEGKGEEKKEEIVRALKRGKMLLKAFGIMKATRTEYEGTRYTPEDYKSKKTVGDVITEGSGHQSEYNPPPVRGRVKLQTRPHSTNIEEETYEDVERQTQRRDESYQAGRPSGQKVGRRGETRGYKGETADIGPRQRFMDVGQTGTPAKPTGRTAITARDQDRSRGKDWESHNIKTKRPKLRIGRGTQSEASDAGLGIRESEAERKKRLAALSPEERAKTPLQRLQEDDKELERKQAERMKKRQQKVAAEKLLKAFGVPISMPGGKQRILPINPNSEGGFFIKARSEEEEIGEPIKEGERDDWGRKRTRIKKNPNIPTPDRRGKHHDVVTESPEILTPKKVREEYKESHPEQFGYPPPFPTGTAYSGGGSGDEDHKNRREEAQEKWRKENPGKSTPANFKPLKPALGFKDTQTKPVTGTSRSRRKKTFGFGSFLEAMLKSYSWNRHGLHPEAKRPKTVTEKSDGGERNFSGARGKTPAILGMFKARKRIEDMTGKEIIAANKRGELRVNRSYRPGQGPHPAYAQKPAQRELPFSTEDRDHIAPTPEPQKPLPHGDDLPAPTQRGGSKQGSKAQKLIPKEGWKEAALLWPTQPKDNGKGRKVKTRVGDSIGGYPT